MADERERTHRGPTDEVGSEGGSPGEIEIDRETDTLTGTELEQNVSPAGEHVEKHDHQLERDGRPAPRP